MGLRSTAATVMPSRSSARPVSSMVASCASLIAPTTLADVGGAGPAAAFGAAGWHAVPTAEATTISAQDTILRSHRLSSPQAVVVMPSVTAASTCGRDQLAAAAGDPFPHHQLPVTNYLKL